MKNINKDFKTILMLGVISIIISGFALYSFKDIKFKNTNNLKNNINTVEVKKEYEELLNETQKETPQTQTGSINIITTGNLSILIPKFFTNSGFTKIINDLKIKEINTTINYIDNFSQYKKLIKDSGLNNFDIYLLPTNWIKDLNLNIIDIIDNPKPYFHPIFNDIVTTTNNKYIPYALDPIVIIEKSNIEIGSNRNDIFSYTTLRKQNKGLAMPIIRGIGKNDIRLLEKGQSPFENYTDILNQHITQIKNLESSNKISELKNMLDTENISLNYKYDFAKFKQLYTTIQKRDNNCELFPAICLMSYNFGDIKFGFLSDLDILDTYFSGNTNNFKINNFSNSQNNYPIKGRVFIVGENNKNISLANEFFKQYLSEGVNNNKDLRNNTLSAVNNIYDLQKNDINYFNKYKKILENQNNFKLIYENINFEIDKNTIEMLKGNYNINLYLN